MEEPLERKGSGFLKKNSKNSIFLIGLLCTNEASLF